MIVSWEFKANESPNEIASNKRWVFKPSELFERDGNNLIDWDTANGLIKIVPKSGNTNPYEPELFT